VERILVHRALGERLPAVLDAGDAGRKTHGLVYVEFRARTGLARVVG
jgi:hypothetical protein